MTIGQIWRTRRRRVAFDGEGVEITDGPIRTRFRPTDVVAARAGASVAPHLVDLRVRRPERTLGGVRIPDLRRPGSPRWCRRGGGTSSSACRPSW